MSSVKTKSGRNIGRAGFITIRKEIEKKDGPPPICFRRPNYQWGRGCRKHPQYPR